MPPLTVSDTSSNRRDQIANFAEMLRGSPLKIKLVTLIYRGKKIVKTVSELASGLKKTRKEVLSLATPLASQGLFDKTKILENGKNLIAYSKIAFVSANKAAILKMARNPKKLESYATKTNPKSSVKTTITVRTIRPARATYCSILDLDQFMLARKIKLNQVRQLTDRISEETTKKGFAEILGELQTANDWGGEIADIISGRALVRGKNKTVAFALKGPAKKGPLFPGKMGKNGDQIQRLFRAPAQYHFVQYEGLIDPSVTEQMQQLAKAKSLMGQDVYYGVIDGVDTKKIRLAFPKKF